MAWSFDVTAPHDKITAAIDAVEVLLSEDEPETDEIRDAQVEDAREFAKKRASRLGKTYRDVRVTASGVIDRDNDDPESSRVGVIVENVPAPPVLDGPQG